MPVSFEGPLKTAGQAFSQKGLRSQGREHSGTVRSADSGGGEAFCSADAVDEGVRMLPSGQGLENIQGGITWHGQNTVLKLRLR